MRILFITMVWPLNGAENMYSDLMAEFIEREHEVDVIALSEKRLKIKTHIDNQGLLNVLYVKCGNIQKINKYSKVINSFLAGERIITASYKYLKYRKYDLILFALPPLTIAPAVLWLKRRYQSKLYLLLKEFWPQDPVDLGAMKYGGIVWKVFRFLERTMYQNSDFIGTMSEAGIDYLRKNNNYINAIIEVCPNSQKAKFIDINDKNVIREKYGIPTDKCVFVFGGNFGVSQGIPEMINSIKSCGELQDAFFLLVGSGTEFSKVKQELCIMGKEKVKIIDYLPRNEFDYLLCACDVGLIFLYPQYTVPNIPSRMISYLLAKLPVLAAVDQCTDAGDIICEANCGIKVINGDVEEFKNAVKKLLIPQTRMEMSLNCEKLMISKYTTEAAYKTIISHLSEQ